MLTFILNNETIETVLPPGMTVLDFVRYNRNLKGTKIGCREGDCGACTVLVGALTGYTVQYKSMTSCLMPLRNAANKHIVTVEGINATDGHLTPVQRALVEENGTQCGFCTVGFVMSLTNFCISPASGTKAEAIAHMDGNICRCTGYKSIERAAGRMVELISSKDHQPALAFAVSQKIIPDYFLSIASRLKEMQEKKK